MIKYQVPMEVQMDESGDVRALAVIGRRALGLAHDLGKPLFVLEHVLERMGSGPGGPSSLRRDVETGRAMVRELSSAVSHFMYLVREGASAPATVAPLEELVSRAVLVISEAWDTGRVIVDLDDRVGRLRYPDLLVRVIVNVLDNALIASPTGKPVRLRARQVSAGAYVDVVDSGAGMSERAVGRALEMAVTARSGGTAGHGIGLAASRDLLTSMGGTIALRSQSGVGTEVRIALPRAARD